MFYKRIPYGWCSVCMFYKRIPHGWCSVCMFVGFCHWTSRGCWSRHNPPPLSTVLCVYPGSSPFIVDTSWLSNSHFPTKVIGYGSNQRGWEEATLFGAILNFTVIKHAVVGVNWFVIYHTIFKIKWMYAWMHLSQKFHRVPLLNYETWQE